MELNVIDKQRAIRDFFLAYVGDIEGSINEMSPEKLRDYLTSDIFIGVASAATGIEENEFVEYAVKHAGRLLPVKRG